MILNSTAGSLGLNGLYMPKDISGLVLWLDANDPNANGTMLNNGDAVADWYSKGSYAFTAKQGDSTKRPGFTKDTATGRCAVKFNGTSHFLEIGYSDLLNSTQLTAFVVCKALGGTNWRSPLTSRNSSPITKGYLFYAGPSTQNYWTFWVGNNSTTNWHEINDTDPVNNNLVILAGLAGASSNAFYVNNKAINASSTIYQPNLSKNMYIGAGENGNQFYFNGHIHEILIYNRLLSEIEIQQNYVYLSLKWGNGI